jgi:hypothetical protein
MAFTSKHIVKNKEEEPQKAPLPNSSIFTKQELEILLLTIKDSSFKGEHVETIYSLVYKLQQQYMAFN